MERSHSTQACMMLLNGLGQEGSGIPIMLRATQPGAICEHHRWKDTSRGPCLASLLVEQPPWANMREKRHTTLLEACISAHIAWWRHSRCTHSVARYPAVCCGCFTPRVLRRHPPDFPLGGVHCLLQLIPVLICHISPERLHYLHVPALQPGTESCDSGMLQEHQTASAFAIKLAQLCNTNETNTVPFPLHPITTLNWPHDDVARTL